MLGMLKSETVLVLGAGASCNLGFPTGPQLLQLIGRALEILPPSSEPRSGDPEILAAFQRIAGSDGLVSLIEAGHRIREAAQNGADNGNSIDNIIYQLEGHADVSLVAKLIISGVILASEKNCLDPKLGYGISKDILKNSWYPLFMNLLCQGINRTTLSSIFDHLSVVNFNYDRSFEYFLPFSLTSTFGIEMDEARKLASSLRIFHPYGSLGLLPWQVGGKDKVEFGQRGVLPETLAAGIRTFTERVQEGNEIQEWRKLVHQSQKLVIIGFGFHDQNLDLLESEAAAGTPNVGRVVGTTFGMPEPHRAMVSDRVMTTFSNRTRVPELPNLPAKEFLVEYGYPIIS